VLEKSPFNNYFGQCADLRVFLASPLDIVTLSTFPDGLSRAMSVPPETNLSWRVPAPWNLPFLLTANSRL